MFNIGYEIKKNNNISRRRESISLSDQDLYKYINLQIRRLIGEGFLVLNVKVIERNSLLVKNFIIDDGELILKNKYNLSEKVRTASSKVDYQQSKVYGWEGKTFIKYGIYNSVFSQNQMIEYINFVLKKINIDEIEIKFIGNKNFSSFNFNYQLKNDDVSLNFSDLMLNKFIALHEISHYIVFMRRISDSAHGEYFLGIYAYLISRFININKKYLYKTMDESGLKYIDCEEAKKVIDNVQ